MNFVEVTVVPGPNGAQIKLPGGALLSPPSQFHGALVARRGLPLIMGIRPEHLAEGSQTAPLVMTVENVETLGSHRLLIGTLAGAPFTAQVSSGYKAVEGQTAGLAPDLQHLHLFDATTKLSLLGSE